MPWGELRSSVMASGPFPSIVRIPPGSSECSALLGSRFSFHPDCGPGWVTCFGCGLGAQVPCLCPRWAALSLGPRLGCREGRGGGWLLSQLAAS